ncbi:MAG: hypothetical protein LBR65_09130 [Culturomica sp.]|jgi:hypothetical protein|nr:hypothetical protein [Culturomica sp.]
MNLNLNLSDYVLLAVLIFLLACYPLLRKLVSSVEIFVGKYAQQAAREKREAASGGDGAQSVTQTLVNLRLLAHERMILFTERIKPDSLIPRTLNPALSAREYQRMLAGDIRQEYEYNLSQQLYLSEEAWSVISDYKNSVITLIHSAAGEIAGEQPAGELAKKVLEQYIASDIKADRVIRVLKQELQ